MKLPEGYWREGLHEKGLKFLCASYLNFHEFKRKNPMHLCPNTKPRYFLIRPVR